MDPLVEEWDEWHVLTEAWEEAANAFNVAPSRRSLAVVLARLAALADQAVCCWDAEERERRRQEEVEHERAMERSAPQRDPTGV